MSIGLKKGTVQIVPYDSNCVIEFNNEKNKLIKVFDTNIIAIEHIGSTSILDMSAKPIIDINLVIINLEDAKNFIVPLQELGYEYMTNRWFEDRYFLPKGPNNFRTHHLNLVEQKRETAWLNPLIFRDYLINNSEAKQQYNDLKINLSKKYENERDKYTEGKNEFITEILKKAKNN